MTWSFPIGHLFGSELRVHVTFFLLIAWIGATGWLQGGPAAAAVYILYVLILFACVIAHEFGHALTARRYGIRTPDVTLLPIGGLARLEKMPEKPGQEIIVALAGPAVNVVIFLVLALILGPARLAEASFTEITLASLPAQVAILNLVLAVFNLIPAFPMDGGRVLRAVLSLSLGRASATRAAATAGQVLAFVMGLLGLVAGNPFLLLIAFFIFMAAGAERADEAMRTLARGLLARDAMITEYETLRPDDSLDLAATTLIRTTQHEFPVIDPETGRFEGLLTRAGLYRALEASPRPARVVEVMERELPTSQLTEPLSGTLTKMQTGAPAVMVIGREGTLVGYITRENVGELMIVANARGG
ncbi:site-2 protease family protein [Sinisalibacter lacisalsi]|uniref:Zinc metalloprotease n=1 Tax=Sinisalibacter lacisalsi TaxID=1526570 RepID=A0ABQ1QMR0_9RHOB|nr:site-2 protease family protein [Sinisalibacter lacisalsi]GGD32126.1 protease [Sinisalibacter lacisalsi]